MSDALRNMASGEGGFAPRLRLPPGYLGTKNESGKEEGLALGRRPCIGVGQ
jgi:hypothetical protein